MKRAARLTLYLVLGLLLGCVSVLAFAETITATTAPNRPLMWWTGSGTIYEYADLLAPCKATLSAANQPYAYVDMSSGSARCMTNENGTVVVRSVFKATCPTGYSNTGGVCVATTAVACPTGQNWTLSGTTCTRPDCVAPQVRNESTGICEAPKCVAGATSTASRYNGRYYVGPGDKFGGVNTPVPATLCNGSCVGTPGKATNCNAATVAGSPLSCDYPITLTGESCTGGNGSAPVPSVACPSGQTVVGLVNGKEVCGDGSPGLSPTTTVTKKTTTTSTSTTTTTTTVSCTGDGACSTTVSSSVTSGGSGANGTGTGSTTTDDTKTTDESLTSYCKENPTAQQCAGTTASVGQSTIEALPTLYTAKYPDGLKGVWKDNISAIKATPLFGLTAVFTPSIGGGSCPAWSVDTNIGPHMNFGSSSFAPPCWVWTALRTVFLITALLTARYLIFGG